MEKYDIFISFATEDIEVAEKVCSLLADYNLSAEEQDKVGYFIYTESIYCTEDFINKITRALSQVKTVLFLASKSSYNSKWCKKEIFQAAEKDIPISTYVLDDEPMNEEFAFLIGPQRWHNRKDVSIEDMIGELLTWLKRKNINISSSSNRSQNNQQNDIDIYKQLNGPLKELYAKALTGDTYAMLEFAKHLYEGKGVRHSFTLAKEWFRKAAIADQAEAEYYMSLYARFGIAGEIVDLNEAFIWCRKAAEHGFEQAIFQTGMDYYNGSGVVQCYEKAVYWWEKASSFNVIAKYNLGVCHENGLGTDVNYEKALECYLISANLGDADAQENLAIMYNTGKGVKQDNEKAFKYFALAAKQGKVKSIYNLGVLYANGLGVKKDIKKAVEYYKRAASMGLPSANYNLGNCYALGEGVESDIMKALIHYEKAAKKGHQKAERNYRILMSNIMGGHTPPLH